MARLLWHNVLQSFLNLTKIFTVLLKLDFSFSRTSHHTGSTKPCAHGIFVVQLYWLFYMRFWNMYIWNSQVELGQ